MGKVFCGENEMMLSCIDHVNIVVNDLEGMLSFYRDVLGFPVTRRVVISGEWLERLVGLNDVRAEVVYLSPPSGPAIELIKYFTPQAERPAGLELSNTPGLRHVAFQVEDLDRVVAHLKSAGVRLLSDIQCVPESQVSFSGGARKRLVYFADPEGNLLELCEYK